MPLSVRGRILPMCSNSPLRRIFAKLTLSTVGHLSCGPGSGVLAHSPGRLHRPFIISCMFTYVNKIVRLFTRYRCIRKVYIVPSLRELETWMGTGQVANRLGYS